MHAMDWHRTGGRIGGSLAVAMAAAGLPALAADLGTQAAEVFSPVTFSVQDSTWEGNPYDVEASATFTHEGSGEAITTYLYHDGGDRWRFRFTGTRPGRWRFETAGDDADLAGHTGAVEVKANPAARGFLTGRSTKYARMVGSPDRLEAQPYVVWMNQRAPDEAVNPGFGSDNLAEDWGGEANAERRAAYLKQAKEHGANAVFLHVKNEWLQAGAQGHDDHDSVNPDRAVFAAIEDLVRDAHEAGMQVHLWAWGDESHRKWTPAGLPGGINGKVDRRIQRYIADRLGPLPGWSIGYGFDLFEWTSQEEVSAWANFINERSGWVHNFSARGLPLLGPDGTEASAPPNFLDSYASLIRGGQILQTDASRPVDDGGPDSYAETLENVQNDPARPIIYEERHAYKRYWNRGDSAWPTTDMDGTRRLYWWWTMAGGAGGWIGFYDGGVSRPGPYPNPEQLRTHGQFWKDRLELDMVPANELAGGTPVTGVALADPARDRIVIYVEDASEVALRLGECEGPWQAVAVDARQPYAEQPLDAVEAGDQTLELPGKSDWAVSLVRAE
ncbi:MAG: DUF5060 domain-containing protein [Phycisphaeraceae bacterium]